MANIEQAMRWLLAGEKVDVYIQGGYSYSHTVKLYEGSVVRRDDGFPVHLRNDEDYQLHQATKRYLTSVDQLAGCKKVRINYPDCVYIGDHGCNSFWKKIPEDDDYPNGSGKWHTDAYESIATALQAGLKIEVIE